MSLQESFSFALVDELFDPNLSSESLTNESQSDPSSEIICNKLKCRIEQLKSLLQESDEEVQMLKQQLLEKDHSGKKIKEENAKTLKSKTDHIYNLKGQLAAQEAINMETITQNEHKTIQIDALIAEIEQLKRISDALAVSAQSTPNRPQYKEGTPLDFQAVPEDFPIECSDTEEAHTEPVHKEACVQMFRFGLDACRNREQCKRDHSASILQKKGICFADFERKGSCPRSDDECWFTHRTPQALRDEPHFQEIVRKLKISKSTNKSSPQKDNSQNNQKAESVSSYSEVPRKEDDCHSIPPYGFHTPNQHSSPRQSGHKNMAEHGKDTDGGSDESTISTRQLMPEQYPSEQSSQINAPFLDQKHLFHALQQMQICLSMVANSMPQSFIERDLQGVRN